jgi:hypothetical protein
MIVLAAPFAAGAPAVVVLRAPYTSFAPYSTNSTSLGTCAKGGIGVPLSWNATSGLLATRMKAFAHPCSPNLLNQGLVTNYESLISNITFPRSGHLHLNATWRVSVAYEALVHPYSACALNYSAHDSFCLVSSSIGVEAQTALEDLSTNAWGQGGFAEGRTVGISAFVETFNYSEAKCVRHTCTVLSSNNITKGSLARFRGVVFLHADMDLRGNTSIVASDRYQVVLTVSFTVDSVDQSFSASPSGTAAAVASLDVASFGHGMTLTRIAVT